jgi:hypothetical protein
MPRPFVRRHGLIAALGGTLHGIRRNRKGEPRHIFDDDDDERGPVRQRYDLGETLGVRMPGKSFDIPPNSSTSAGEVPASSTARAAARWATRQYRSKVSSPSSGAAYGNQISAGPI